MPYCIGRLALGVIDRLADGQVGTIVQNFKNTIYVRTIDDELICITSYGIKGPVNMNVENNVELGMIGIHEPVYKLNKMLKICDLVLPLRSVSIHEKRRQSTISEGLEKRIFGAADLLSILAVEGCLVDSSSPFLERASKQIRNIMRTAKTGNFIDLQDAITGIVGLGSGSTPSGDDFLAGFLYCLRQVDGTRNCRVMTITIGSKTSWHSRKFIEYAQEGFVIEPLEAFVNVLLSGTEETITESILDLSKIGHSSGLDAAIGVVIAASVMLDDPCCDSVLKKLGL